MEEKLKEIRAACEEGLASIEEAEQRFRKAGLFCPYRDTWEGQKAAYGTILRILNT